MTVIDTSLEDKSCVELDFHTDTSIVGSIVLAICNHNRYVDVYIIIVKLDIRILLLLTLL